MDMAGKPFLTGDGSGVNDFTLPGFNHMRGHRLGEQIDPLGVDIYNLVPVRFGHIGQQQVPVETGVVGLTVFILLLWRVAKNINTALKHLPEEKGIAIGIFCALISILGFMVGIEAAYQRHLWLLFACAEVLYMLAVTRQSEVTQMPAIGSTE